jgi:hypothetical protein
MVMLLMSAATGPHPRCRWCRLYQLVLVCLRAGSLHAVTAKRFGGQCRRLWDVAAPVGVLVHGAVAVGALAVRAQARPAAVCGASVAAVDLGHGGLGRHARRSIDGVVHPLSLSLS